MELQFFQKNFIAFGFCFLMCLIILFFGLLISSGVAYDIFDIDVKRFFYTNSRKIKIFLSILVILIFCFSFFVGFSKN